MPVVLSNNLSAHTFTSKNSKTFPLKTKVENSFWKRSQSAKFFCSLVTAKWPRWAISPMTHASPLPGAWFQCELCSCHLCSWAVPWLPVCQMGVTLVSQAVVRIEWAGAADPEQLWAGPERPWVKPAPQIRRAGYTILLGLPLANKSHWRNFQSRWTRAAGVWTAVGRATVMVTTAQKD